MPGRGGLVLGYLRGKQVEHAVAIGNPNGGDVNEMIYALGNVAPEAATLAIPGAAGVKAPSLAGRLAAFGSKLKGPLGRSATNGARADFIASADGVVIPTSRNRLVAGFEQAGLPSTPTSSAGTQYTLPGGSLVRVMEPSGQAPLRASFANANGGPINPFTGKPVQPPPGSSTAERLDYIRSRTHIELSQ